MVKRKLGALEKVEADLPNLQYKIRRDPESYENDFLSQYQTFQTYYQLVLQSPSSAPNDNLISLKDLIDFIAHVAYCYPKLTAAFPSDLIALLNQHHAELEPELREKVVGGLLLLRKNDIVDSITLLNAIFPILLSTPSKSLRMLLYQKLISDVRNSNSKATAHKLNRALQTVLFNLLSSDPTSPKTIWAVRITRELWRRQVWTDSRTVEIMKEAALSSETKTIIGGVKFFLGGDKEREEAAEESDGDEPDIDIKQVYHQAGINKKTRKNEKALKNARVAMKKKEKKRNAPHPLNFSALHLLNDPQEFAEKLFARHLHSGKSKLNLEQKLQVLQLVTRLVSLHQLTIEPLYSYFLRFLTPKQANVTSFLASLAQATHALVPPDALEPLVQKVVNEFVSEASASEVAAVGLNTIREVFARQPLCMNETLLQDLVQYKSSKDKGVMMAAKGLLSQAREKTPHMLKKKDRGKEVSLGMRDGAVAERRFGEVSAGQIEGLELLEAYKEEERKKKRIEAGLDPDADVEDEELEEEEGWKNWDVESQDSDDSGGWINVSSDGEDIEISDSEDEKIKPAKKRTKADQEGAGAKNVDDGHGEDSIPAQTTNISTLATTRILTPADLAKLNELRQSSTLKAHLPKHLQRKAAASANANGSTWSADAPVTVEDMAAIAALGKKVTKEDKVALAKADRDTDHRGATAKRKEKKQASGKSTTNKEKARQKNMMMLVGKARGKNKRSLQEVGKVLRGHTDRQKRGGKRGNR